MNKYVIYALIFLTLSSCNGKHRHSSGSKSHGSGHSHACNEKIYPGIDYQESCQESFLAGRCRDLTDEEIDKINEEENLKNENKKMKEMLFITKVIMG